MQHSGGARPMPPAAAPLPHRQAPHLVARVGKDAVRGGKAQRALLNAGHRHGRLEIGVAAAAHRQRGLRQRALRRARQHAHAAQLGALGEEGGGARAGGVLAQRRGGLKHVVGQARQLVLPLKAAGRGRGARGCNQVHQRRVGCRHRGGGGSGRAGVRRQHRQHLADTQQGRSSSGCRAAAPAIQPRPSTRPSPGTRAHPRTGTAGLRPPGRAPSRSGRRGPWPRTRCPPPG